MDCCTLFQAFYGVAYRDNRLPRALFAVPARHMQIDCIPASKKILL